MEQTIAPRSRMKLGVYMLKTSLDILVIPIGDYVYIGMYLVALNKVFV